MIKTALDALLERTVVPSFSSIGSRIRKRLFQWPELETYNLQGQVVVITGATSGIGEHAALLLAQLGATLVIVGRNKQKTDDLIEKLKTDTGNQSIHAVIGDLGNQDDVHNIANDIASQFPAIHTLAHNAGALFNTRKRAENGTDLSVELMVSTPFLLTGLLLPQLLAASNEHPDSQPASVLTMSSGGMYTEALRYLVLRWTMKITKVRNNTRGLSGRKLFSMKCGLNGSPRVVLSFIRSTQGGLKHPA